MHPRRLILETVRDALAGTQDDHPTGDHPTPARGRVYLWRLDAFDAKSLPAVVIHTTSETVAERERGDVDGAGIVRRHLTLNVDCVVAVGAKTDLDAALATLDAAVEAVLWQVEVPTRRATLFEWQKTEWFLDREPGVAQPAVLTATLRQIWQVAYWTDVGGLLADLPRYADARDADGLPIAAQAEGTRFSTPVLATPLPPDWAIALPDDGAGGEAGAGPDLPPDWNLSGLARQYLASWAPKIGPAHKAEYLPIGSTPPGAAPNQS